MKMPNISKWISYGTTTLAVSGLLLVGGCDNNSERQTADNTDFENEVEATENEPQTPERENVNLNMAENQEEQQRNEDNAQKAAEKAENTANNGDQIQYEKTSASPDHSASAMRNMDAHIDEHEDVNENIRETLTDQPNAYFIIYELYHADIEDAAYTKEERRQIEEIMNEYRLRRESMRGKMDPKTKAYTSPEVDPQPKMGMEKLLDKIQDNMNYPQNAAAAEAEGTVFVNFIVDRYGNIENAKANPNVVVPTASKASASGVLNPTNFSENGIEELKKEMMKEAVKAVKSTSGQWEPAMHNGERVRAEIQLPVVFRIDNI